MGLTSQWLTKISPAFFPPFFSFGAISRLYFPPFRLFSRRTVHFRSTLPPFRLLSRSAAAMLPKKSTARKAPASAALAPKKRGKQRPTNWSDKQWATEVNRLKIMNADRRARAGRAKVLKVTREKAEALAAFNAGLAMPSPSQTFPGVRTRAPALSPSTPGF